MFGWPEGEKIECKFKLLGELLDDFNIPHYTLGHKAFNLKPAKARTNMFKFRIVRA